MVSAAPDPKQLASNVKKTRDAAVLALTNFLQVGSSLEDADASVGWQNVQLDARFAEKQMQVLWKGLFYCMWMSDKPLVQQQLCSSLAKLVLDIRPSQPGRPARVTAAMAFLRGFWSTMTREWHGVDRYRADKYYLLMRRYFECSFMLLKREEWDPEAVIRHNEVLTGLGGPLNVREPKTPFGIISHVSEVYLTALCCAMEGDVPRKSDPIPLLSLLAPLMQALCFAPSRQIYNAVLDNAILPLIVACDSAHESGSATPPAHKKRKLAAPGKSAPIDPLNVLLQAPVVLSEADSGQGASQRKHAVLALIFEEAAKPETHDTNRRRLYTFFRQHEGQG